MDLSLDFMKRSKKSIGANVDLKKFRKTMKQYIGGARENERNFYHPDHLGSGSWITDVSGKPVQHLQYLPYGEPYINQRLSGYNERFTFTGKEKDEETGYGYFGARYMDHDLMTMWLSVDPLADKYPSISPYAYCAWNPVRLVDPDGRDVWEINKSGELIWKNRSDTDKIISSNGSFVNVKNGVLRRGTDNTPGLSYTKEELGHFRLEFGDDSKNATEVFEFLADNANVEFSLIGLANAPSNENANRFILTSSFENDGDCYGSTLACSASLDNKMRSHSHNHPGRNASIVPSSILNNGTLLVPFSGIKKGDDLGFANYVLKGSPSCTFNIYHSSKGGEYRPYAINKQGVPDYSYIPSQISKQGGQYVFAQ